MAVSGKPNYLDPHVLERIKRLDLRARLVVEGFINGLHESPYHGFAIEFASHREYTPGDDIKHIDWKVWSKTDRLYIKEYEEETNLNCTIILDCSKSMDYGRAKGFSKFDYAATATASLTHLLQSQQDAVGLITFSNQVEKHLRASSHPNHLKQVVHELECTAPARETDIEDVFPTLAGQIRHRGLVVLVSDLFMQLETLESALKQFRLRGHEVVVFHLMHDDELNFPFEDNTLFKGLEVLKELHADPRALRKAYLEVVGKYLDRVQKTCNGADVDYSLVNTKDHLDAVLSSYLSYRQRTGKRRRR
jgi:uncharacterized protein (DUF58 family)